MWMRKDMIPVGRWEDDWDVYQDPANELWTASVVTDRESDYYRETTGVNDRGELLGAGQYYAFATEEEAETAVALWLLKRGD